MLLSAAAKKQCYISFSFVYVIPARLFPHLLCSCFSLRSQAHTHKNTHRHTSTSMVQHCCQFDIACYHYLFWFWDANRTHQAWLLKLQILRHIKALYQLNCIIVRARNNAFLFASTLIFLNKLADNTTPTTDTRPKYRATKMLCLHTNV